MRRVAVLSSIYGDYDPPKIQPRQTVDAEWILVTDHEVDAPGWNVVVEPRPYMHPCLAAKVPKCVPSLYTEATTTVWMDGSCQLLGTDSLWRILASANALGHPDGATLSQIGHPDRDCVYDEAAFCVPVPKYAGLPLAQQAEHYRKEEHPEHWGLWATGLIVRHGWSANVVAFGQAWLLDQVRWGFQDQVSEAPVLRVFGLRPRTLPFSLHGNGILEWRADHH